MKDQIIGVVTEVMKDGDTIRAKIKLNPEPPFTIIDEDAPIDWGKPIFTDDSALRRAYAKYFGETFYRAMYEQEWEQPKQEVFGPNEQIRRGQARRMKDITHKVRRTA